MANTEKFDVVVVGSCVQDLVSYVPQFPGPGEDIMASRFSMAFGGKGANQAVMAAKLGAKTAMVGKVGKDMFGPSTVENFISHGVNADEVGFCTETNTATANVLVEDSGQNSIVVVLGANMAISVDDIRHAEGKIAHSKVVACQLEVKEEVTLEALKLAKKHGVTTIFNPAPGPPGGLPDEYFKCSDILIPNESEAELLSGFHLESDQDVDRALEQFLQRGAKAVIITLGSKGCAFATTTNPKPTRVGIPKVKAVDTTGAGDSFVGSLAYYTACHANMPLEERIKRACRIASISVQSAGTQTAYPKRDQLPKELFDS